MHTCESRMLCFILHRIVSADPLQPSFMPISLDPPPVDDLER